MERGPRSDLEFADSLWLHHDVASESDWRNLIEKTQSRCGRIDILISNAGICHPKSLLETDFVDMERHFRVNQHGIYLRMKHAALQMVQSGGGSIVNISSGAAFRGIKSRFAYSASKWAIRGMSRCAALDLAE